MTADEALEVSIYPVAGMLGPERTVARRRPFRGPHHTRTYARLVGGGSSLRPRRDQCGAPWCADPRRDFRIPHARVGSSPLRQPIDDGIVTIGRARGPLRFRPISW